jgi:hypothetical protein
VDVESKPFSPFAQNSPWLIAGHYVPPLRLSTFKTQEDAILAYLVADTMNNQGTPRMPNAIDFRLKAVEDLPPKGGKRNDQIKTRLDPA